MNILQQLLNFPPVTDKTKKQLADDAMNLAMNFGPMALAIKAYHGSPAKFNKFVDEYLRTGEGVTAFGEGHYSGSNPQVLDSFYRKRLAEQKFGENTGYGYALNLNAEPEQLIRYGESLADQTPYVKNIVENLIGKDKIVTPIEKTIRKDTKVSWDAKLRKDDNLASTLKALTDNIINPQILNFVKQQNSSAPWTEKEVAMSVWDLAKKAAKSNKQPELKDFLQYLGRSGPRDIWDMSTWGTPTGATKAFSVDSIVKNSVDAADTELNDLFKYLLDSAQNIKSTPPITKTILKTFDPNSVFKQGIDQSIFELVNGPIDVKKTLIDSGIKGLQFIGQGGKGRPNYVMFDPNDIEIYRRIYKGLDNPSTNARNFLANWPDYVKRGQYLGD